MSYFDETPESNQENTATPQEDPQGQSEVTGQGPVLDESAGATGPVEDPEQEVRTPGQPAATKPQLIGGKFKSMNAAITGYTKLMERLGEANDVDDYTDVASLMRAYNQAEKRLTQKGQQGQLPQYQSSINVDETDDIELLNTELFNLEAEIENYGKPQAYQQPAQQYQQPVQQPVQPVQQTQPGQSDDSDPGDWLENELYVKGPGAIRDIIARELEVQGKQLGEALYQILQPMHQTLTEVRSERDYNKQLKALESKGVNVSDYAEEMAKAYDKHPQLAAMPNGVELAFNLARTQRKVGTLQGNSKGGLRMPQGGGTRLPQNRSAEDTIVDAIFGGNGGGGFFE